LKRVSVKYSIFLCLIMFTNFTGCGVKGNPIILSTIPDNGRILQNLKATVSDNAVILEWDYYGKNSKNNYIALEKSEVGSAGNECKDCPRTFERIGQITLKEMKRENKGSDSFIDKKVTKGKTYSYRLLFCDDFNICFENAIIEIIFK
jgi:hypothetical protein